MPIPFLTLNKSVGDIDSLVIPVDCSDVKTKLAYSWTVWVQTDSEVSEDVADYDSMTKSIAEFDSLEVCRLFFIFYLIRRHFGGHSVVFRSLRLF